MKAAFCLIACVAFAGLVSAEASARFDGTSLSFDNALGKAWNTILAQSSNALQSNDEKPKKAVVLIEYAVPPPEQLKFIELFKDLQEATEKEEGVIVFGLSRTIDENLTYYLYSEFDSMKSYASQSEQEATKEFIKGIYKLGVVYKIHILDQITGFKSE